MTKKIVKRTDANNETLYFYTHSDAVDVGEGNNTTSLTNALNSKASASDVQALSDDALRKSPQSLSSQEKSQVHNNIGTESFVDDRAVRYDDAQVLSSEEKTQALTNLGLNGVDDEPTPNSNNLVKSGGVQNEFALGAVYDVSAKNPTAGLNNDGKWESLSALLSDANLNTLIPLAVRKGGMSIKFVQSSDNKYVQYRLMNQSFSTTESDWQGVDDEPTDGSENLVKSGGVKDKLNYLFGWEDIQAVNGWIADNIFFYTGGTHKTIKIYKQGMHLSVVAGTNGASFVLLKNYSIPTKNTPYDLATGETGRISLSANQKLELDLPLDVRYIAIGAVYFSTQKEYTPISFKLDGIEIITEVKTLISENFTSVNSRIDTLTADVNTYEKHNDDKIGYLFGLEGIEENVGWVAASVFDINGGTHKALYIGEGHSTLKITAGINSCYFFIAKSYNQPTSTTSPDYATGEDARRYVAAGETNSFTLPNDAKYIVLGCERQDKNFLPSSLEVDGVDYALNIKGDITTLKKDTNELKGLEYIFSNADSATSDVAITEQGEAEICFIIPETHTTAVCIFSSNYLVVYFLNGGTNTLTCRVGPSTYLYGLANLENNVCYVLRVRWDNGKAWIYINGNLIREAEYTGNVSGNLHVGRGNASQPAFIAQILYMSINGNIISANSSFDRHNYSLYEKSEVNRLNIVTKTVSDAIKENNLPLYCPAPQLPANDETDSDFNCETVTATILQDAFDALVETLPTYVTLYEKVVKDCTDIDDLKAYIFTRKNRYAWKAAEPLYAWKNGSTIVYIESCSPVVGANIYSDIAKTNIVGTITSYNYVSGISTMVDNNNIAYIRDEVNNISIDVIYSKNTTNTSIDVFNDKDLRLGSANGNNGTTCTYSGKTYTRCASYDYHTDARFTIILVGNVHGPQSDPMEPSVTLYRLAKDLCVGSGVKTNRFINYLKQHSRIIMIPAANPSGIRLWVSDGRNGRTNANGVNINRNFDTLGWVSAPSEGSNAKGNYPGDQPETQYIMNLLNTFKPHAAYDIHCYGYVNAAGGSTDNTSAFGRYPTDEVKNFLIEMFYNSFNVKTWSFGAGNPDTDSTANAYISKLGILGSTIELWAGKATNSSTSGYDGNQHTVPVMEFCYTNLLNSIKYVWTMATGVDFNLICT